MIILMLLQVLIPRCAIIERHLENHPVNNASRFSIDAYQLNLRIYLRKLLFGGAGCPRGKT